jgi:hypothetical protein
LVWCISDQVKSAVLLSQALGLVGFREIRVLQIVCAVVVISCIATPKVSWSSAEIFVDIFALVGYVFSSIAIVTGNVRINASIRDRRHHTLVARELRGSVKLQKAVGTFISCKS